MASSFKRPMIAAGLIVAGTMLYAAPAAAQATRTWVSGVGDDANPCSRTAPCKTFAGAISKTATGGEIDCLDPGGFGTLTITKSITIDCTGTLGSSLNASGTNGFVINDGASATPGTAKVVLRGLTINGSVNSPGLNGIRFVSGASLIVQNVIIQNSTGGSGISFQPVVAATMSLNDVTVANSGNITGAGILVQPTGANGSARVTLKNVRLYNNAGAGLKVDSTGNTSAAGSVVTVFESNFSSNPVGVSAITGAGTGSSTVFVSGSMLANNQVGVGANGSTAVIRVTGTSITGGTLAISTLNSGAVRSFGDNSVDGNTNPSSFTAPVIPKT